MARIKEKTRATVLFLVKLQTRYTVKSLRLIEKAYFIQTVQKKFPVVVL